MSKHIAPSSVVFMTLSASLGLIGTMCGYPLPSYNAHELRELSRKWSFVNS